MNHLKLLAMKNMNLKELEKKAYRSVFQDGLWDVFIGFFMAQFVVAPLLSDIGFSDFWSSMIWTIVLLVILAMVMILKKYVVAPRLGTVRLNTKKKRRFGVVLGLINVFLLLGILVGAFYVRLAELNIDWLAPLTFIIVLLVGFSAVAWLFRQPRFYLYGALCTVAYAVGELLYRYAGANHHGLPITFGISSFLVTLTGILLFVTFIRKYPKTDSDLYFQEGNDGNGQ